MLEDDKKPEDGQWSCWAWVNGPRTKKKNDGSTLISKELSHLRRASGKVAKNSINHERQISRKNATISTLNALHLMNWLHLWRNDT